MSIKVDVEFKKLVCVMDNDTEAIKKGQKYYGFKEVSGDSYNVSADMTLNEETGKLNSYIGSYPVSYFEIVGNAGVVTFENVEPKFIPYIEKMENCVLHK